MTTIDTEKKLEILKDAIEDKKAEDIEVIDLRSRSLMADYFVIACGTSNVHIRSIADNAIDKMRAAGARQTHNEGYKEAKWILVDFGDLILHVFAREERDFYDLESLWKATEQALSQ